MNGENWSAWYFSVIYDTTTAKVLEKDENASTLTIRKTDGTEVKLTHNGTDRTYTPN
jgi:hypothetical protein